MLTTTINGGASGGATSVDVLNTYDADGGVGSTAATGNVLFSTKPSNRGIKGYTAIINVLLSTEFNISSSCPAAT
ncbi:hypothetical protein VB269_02235 [Enterobacter mori]|nr:hypothetical protein [Enterobacter mori]MEA5205160.1 hypothetical protein [Enterobacter mori]